MRVLMFGWEFPPHIAGGLGTACYGMTKGLAHCGVDVLFVMPSASGDEDQRSVRIINASDVAVYDAWPNVEDFLGKVQFLRVGSNLHPYIDPVDFTDLVEEEKRSQSDLRRDPRPRLAHLSGRHRRETRFRQAAGDPRPRHLLRPR